MTCYVLNRALSILMVRAVDRVQLGCNLTDLQTRSPEALSKQHGLVIASDLGQVGNMIHPDGLETAIAEMKRDGVTDGDIDAMMRKNQARLLGLSN